jgi:multisubunit Na+/H+ antiporter MnhB subunit
MIQWILTFSLIFITLSILAIIYRLVVGPTASERVQALDVLGIEKIRNNIPFDFKVVAGVGVLIAVLTGVRGMLVKEPFLTQIFGHVYVPLFGETELATAVLFDVGVALAVIGASLTIIISIGDDR